MELVLHKWWPVWLGVMKFSSFEIFGKLSKCAYMCNPKQ